MNYSMKNIKKEFIKSAAVLVLALILLITAVVAWFTNKTTADISDFSLSIQSEDGGIYLGDGVAIERSLVLPCATKVVNNDGSISYNDFAKAMYVETFKVKASENVIKAKVSVALPSSVTDLHYYIEPYYDNNDSNYLLAEWIIDEQDYDNDLVINFAAGGAAAYERTIAVVFWAEYTDSTSTAIKNGNMTFDAQVSFSVVE
ncbi:MAG: hypothetical protein E7652_07305 [Ruminococcaceae bacterium]|nr:hypothetical protein [Oscillospiraceae bacterium]